MSAAELAPGAATVGRERSSTGSRTGVYVGLLAGDRVQPRVHAALRRGRQHPAPVVQVVPVAIIALGMALVIGTGGSTCRSARSWPSRPRSWLCSSATARRRHRRRALGGAAVGLVNGVLIAYFGIQPIVATLALLVGGRGLALVIAQGRLTEIFDPTLGAIGSGRVVRVPIVVLIALAVALVVAVVVARTTSGACRRDRRQPGGERPRGVPVRRTLLAVYVLSASLRGNRGIIQTARLSAQTRRSSATSSS